MLVTATYALLSAEDECRLCAAECSLSCGVQLCAAERSLCVAYECSL